jgi:hypothetical protein
MALNNTQLDWVILCSLFVGCCLVFYLLNLVLNRWKPEFLTGWGADIAGHWNNITKSERYRATDFASGPWYGSGCIGEDERELTSGGGWDSWATADLHAIISKTIATSPCEKRRIYLPFTPELEAARDIPSRKPNLLISPIHNHSYKNSILPLWYLYS